MTWKIRRDLEPGVLDDYAATLERDGTAIIELQFNGLKLQEARSLMDLIHQALIKHQLRRPSAQK